MHKLSLIIILISSFSVSSCGSNETSLPSSINIPNKSDIQINVNNIQLAIVIPKDRKVSNEIYKNIETMVKSANNWFLLQTGKRFRIRKNEDQTINISLIKLTISQDKILELANNLPSYLAKNIEEKDSQTITVFLFPANVKFIKESYCGISSGKTAGLYINNKKCKHKYNSGNGQGWDKIFIHEIIHALGGVADCANNSDGTHHVTDSTSDLMHKNGGGVRPVIDKNHDDYFSHEIDGCFDLAKSKILF